MVEIAKVGEGLRPQDMTTPTTVKIRYADNVEDTVLEEERTAKTGGKFKQYDLHIVLNEEDKVLKYLFARDLQELRKRLGSDTTKWEGKECLISGEKDGDFYKWCLS